jgi:hypothetical protein
VEMRVEMRMEMRVEMRVEMRMEMRVEMRISQTTLSSHERQEVALAQLPGTLIELSSSRRDRLRRSSASSAASSVARRYRPVDDDMEVTQGGL